MKHNISVVILTKNEEKDIGDCLSTVNWSDDLHVFDSYSTDKTISISKGFGAKIWQRVFDNYANQRNAALKQIPFKNKWVLMIDADEQIPLVLHDEMLHRINQASDITSAFRIRRNDFFQGNQLRFSQISPFYIRLFRPSRVKYIREINEVLEVSGQIENLLNCFNHFPFSKGIDHWIQKHCIYSSMEARLVRKENKRHLTRNDLIALFSRDFNKRRYFQKRFFYKLPNRPLIKFLYMFFIRFSFLDGKSGLHYTFLQVFYEFLISLKASEKRKLS